MDLRTQLNTRMEQRLALLPRMLQSIEILQLTAVDLLALIEKEIEANETLEVVRREREDGREALADEGVPVRPSEEAFDTDAFRERPRPAPAQEADSKQAFLNNVADSRINLCEHIGEQLSWLGLPEPLFQAVQALAERLDSRGILSATDEELLAILDAELLDEALQVLQSLDPPGIGGRSPIHAMLLQLSDSDPDLADIQAMLTEHLEALALNKLPDVARALGRSLAEAGALLAKIEKLDPRPGADFFPEANYRVQPDVVVYVLDGELQVEVDEMSLPDLGVNQDYQDLAKKESTEADVKSHLREKLRSARDLISAVEQRKKTLARVAEAVMQHQRGFLERGRSGIRALSMQEIADQLSMHASTVSRAIAGKYVQTDRGILRLRDFFDGDRKSGTATAGGCGRLAIKEQIRELTAIEDSSAPLSDEDLVRLLAERKIEVARRTVAKYRNELGIPSTWRRRSHLEKE